MGSIRRCAPLLLALACFVAAIIASPIPEESAPEAVRETLETLDLETPSHEEEGQRNKRTIGFLRTLFPGLSEIIDRKIQSLTRIIFRLVGRLVLGGGGGGSRSSASSSASSSGGSRRISITLPTFPPSLDDEEEEESQTEQESTSEPNFEDNLAGSESRVNEVRVPYEGGAAELEEEDQEAAATGDDESSAVADNEEPSESDNTAAASDNSADREKRFLFFGGGGDAASSSAGGSGNFLFDIIRLITGSGSTDAAADAGSSGGGDGAAAGLSAGSGDGGDGGNGGNGGNGSNGGNGGNGGASAGGDISAPSPDPNDGYTSGIPGPLTRLFIIANRGISNLLQDLILRLSQTSERIVNFKARLITALI